MTKLSPLTKKEDGRIESALELCIRAHGGQQDDDGSSKFIHIFSVAGQARNADELIVGLLHDSLEDSPDVVSYELLKRRFGPRIANAIFVLTRRDNQTYEEYIATLIASENILAMSVKLYDLEHNLSRNTKGPRFDKRWKQARALIFGYFSSRIFSIPITHGDIHVTA